MTVVHCLSGKITDIFQFVLWRVIARSHQSTKIKSELESCRLVYSENTKRLNREEKVALLVTCGREDLFLGVHVETIVPEDHAQ